jgi:hypothetical protein
VRLVIGVPVWLHRHAMAKSRNQSERLLLALKSEIREHNADNLRLTHELEVALDGNRRLVDALQRLNQEIP